MKKKPATTPVAFSDHDHNQCVLDALTMADQYCTDHRLRFTAVRRRTLGILLESHCAMGAYDILERLKQEGLGSKPPVAYRALAFLLDNGFIHRIERLNAYIACSHPGANHHPAFLICSDCGSVAEASLPASAGGLRESAESSGFAISNTTMEAVGQCPECQKGEGS